MSVLQRSSFDNVDGMIKDIQAVFHHFISTDQSPQHSFCPKGEYSWCKYNKYMHEKAKNPNIDMPVPKHRDPHNSSHLFRALQKVL